MQELRFVAVSEDGRYAVLAVPGRSARFTLPIDERLRAVALGQTSRLAQYEIEVESPLRPKEIQARIRAGETVEEIADAAGIAVERVRWFEGPVLAERAYTAHQAQSALVRRQGDAIPSSPGPRLGEIVTDRLKMFGSDPEEAQWDARKLGDGSWQVQLTFVSGGRVHTAEWIFDPRRRHVLPADDNAARMSLPGAEPPQPTAPAPGEATVTHLTPRLNSTPSHAAPGHAAPGHGFVFGPEGASASEFGQSEAPAFGPGGMSGPGNGSGLGNALGNGGRPRHERLGAGRPTVPEPSVSEPAAAEPREAVAPAVPSAPRVSPATVAAQAPRATPVPRPSEPGETAQPGHMAQPGRTPQTGQAPQPGRAPQSAQAPQPARHAQPTEESRAIQARQETTVAVRPPTAASPAAASPAAASPAAASPAAASPAAPLGQAPASPGPVAQASAASGPPTETPAEPGGEQVARQGRKATRGRRSSVPSWDEIMFGNSRQRD